MDSWTLTASEPRAELLYLANGYLGTALNWDGGMLFESEACPCYARGIYDLSGSGGIDRLALLPCWSRLRYAAPAHLREYTRRLDLRHALLHTCLTLEEPRGLVQIEQTIFASRADPHLAAVHLTLRPQFDGEISMLAGLNAPRGGDLTVLEAGIENGGFQLHARVPAYDIRIAEALSFEGDGWTVCDEAVGQNDVAGRLVATGVKGREMTLVQMVRLTSTLETDDPSADVRGPTPSFAEAERAHRRAWDALWQTDIEIDGDPEVQQFTRAGLYYLWSSVQADDRWSIAPMGLSSNGYNGHIFWDAELWMYPSLLVTQPRLARACVAYREHTIAAARERAAANGHRGAQFPWEGGYTGTEMTPHWADTRDFQLHITADVAIGQWWYFINTQDLGWLRDHGFPVIRACAEYWVSRVEYNAGLDRYEVSDVVCADEYAAHVDNDAFTNAAVRVALLVAARAAQILAEPIAPEWRTIADKMYVPYDAERRVHLEFDGYDGRITKQADVELLAYPLEYMSDPDQVRRDLDYYGTVIDPNGPAMSFSIYSILSAQLGRTRDAYDYLRRSFIPNTRPPFWSFSETPANNEFFFCTGVGGALQALLFGFTGLRLREGVFVLRPILPDHWSALRLRNLYVAGARTDIEIEHDRFLVRRYTSPCTVAVTVRTSPDAPGSVEVTEGAEGLELQLTRADGDVLSHAPVNGNAVLPLSAHPDGVRLRLAAGTTTVMEFVLPSAPVPASPMTRELAD